MERIDSFTADGCEGRFNVPGKTDIVTFRAREVGKPTALWVSVEGKHVKSWTLDCISIVDTFDERPEENAITAGPLAAAAAAAAAEENTAQRRRV